MSGVVRVDVEDERGQAVGAGVWVYAWDNDNPTPLRRGDHPGQCCPCSRPAWRVPDSVLPMARAIISRTR